MPGCVCVCVCVCRVLEQCVWLESCGSLPAFYRTWDRLLFGRCPWLYVAHKIRNAVLDGVQTMDDSKPLLELVYISALCECTFSSVRSFEFFFLFFFKFANTEVCSVRLCSGFCTVIVWWEDGVLETAGVMCNVQCGDVLVSVLALTGAALREDFWKACNYVTSCARHSSQRVTRN